MQITLLSTIFAVARCGPCARACAVAQAFILAGALPLGAHAQHQPVVAVAASVAAAAESIAHQFRQQTGITARLSFGASGNLSRQIRRGAPFELFIAADESYPQGLVDAGLSAGSSTTYATGQLALMVTARSGVELPPGNTSNGDSKTAISRALRDPRIERIAMANPNHAPYGRAARESLQFLHLWSVLQARTVMGESVAQSARFAATDTVQAALLPLGIILHSPLAKEPHRLIPTTWYTPLRQQMVLLKAASNEARQLFAFMLADEARAILVEHGFIVADLVPLCRGTSGQGALSTQRAPTASRRQLHQTQPCAPFP